MKTWEFSQLIINWQHQYGRHNLPWQIKNTPYCIWISEIMLQQTQVKTVIPYFNKFIERFDNIDTLSQSKLDEILHFWSGLGYYNRAHNLYRTAKIIKYKYHGDFPKNIITLMSLPGIGRTTAGAILSFSYYFSFPILDGNVKRILTRFYNLLTSLTKTKLEKKLWQIIINITPIHNAHIFNQGMMDIGSIICTHKKPKCHICPLNQSCQYQVNKNQIIISNHKNIKQKKYFFIILQYKNFIYLKKREKKKIWKQLFCFPTFHNQNEISDFLYKNNINYKNYRMIKKKYHQLTHLKLKLYFFHLYLKKKHKFSINQENMWYNLLVPNYIGLSKPIIDMLSILKNQILKKREKIT